jgi:hypothetical protein
MLSGDVPLLQAMGTTDVTVALKMKGCEGGWREREKKSPCDKRQANILSSKVYKH